MPNISHKIKSEIPTYLVGVRDELMLDMKKRGYSYGDIGIVFGVSRQYTHQRVDEAENGKKASYWYNYRKRNKEKLLAHTYVSKAIASGKLKKPARCVLCLEDKNPEAHHPNYSKPLEVVWVCRPCHRKLHTNNK